MRTSVILCTRNSRVEVVIPFCESLYNQTEPPDELIIVDSGDIPLIADERLADFFKRERERVPLHFIRSEPGLTKQRNVGVRHVTGDIIYFFDDDVFLEPHFLELMNKMFEDHPEYMGGMGTIIGIDTGRNWREKARLASSYIFERFFLLADSYGDGKFQKSGFPRRPYGINEFKEVEILGGGLTGYKREVFKEFSFDEKLEGKPSMDDVDFSRRVSYKYKLFYNPHAKLEHRHIGISRRERTDFGKWTMLNHRYLFYKNFNHRNKLSSIAHWWSILGLFIRAVIIGPRGEVKAFINGLQEFRKRKKELLGIGSNQD